MTDPALTEPLQSRLGPTKDDRRIVALDVLRGFALLGILLVNIMSFGGVATREAGGNSIASQAVEAVIFYGARGAFMSTFAMLFGIGFALQIARIGQADSPNGLKLYVRRMTLLLVFGLAHTLLDPAEVLVLYALCGALLLLFRAVPSRGIVLAA